MNVGEFADMVEMYSGKAGVSDNSINRTLILQLINAKIAELIDETGWEADEAVFQSQSGVMEYDLPSTGLPVELTDVTKVIVDSVRAIKMDFDSLERLQARDLDH